MRAADSDTDRLPVPLNGTGPLKTERPLVLVGIRIPSANENVRQLVVRVYQDSPHLQRADLLAVVRYAALTWKFRRLSEMLDRLPEGGVVKISKGDLEPRKAVSELRALAGELLRHEAALGITANSRAALGIDLVRGHSLAELMSRPEGDQP